MASDLDSLALEFEEHRARLRGVAYRVLGSASDADDAVQETWLRLSRSDVSDVLNLPAWLTTVVGRVALNMLQARKSRREALLADMGSAEVPEPSGSENPEDAALLGDSVGAALQVVLDTLEPRERHPGAHRPHRPDRRAVRARAPGYRPGLAAPAAGTRASL
jgi:RNA polymerase sigma factor (sigma-70 family)